MFQNRIDKIKATLTKNKLEAVLVSSVSNIAYLTGYTNFSPHEREAFLLITKNKQYILTDARYSEAIANQVKHLELVEVSSKKSAKKIISQLSKTHSIKNLGIEEGNLTVAEFNAFSYFKKLKHVDFKKNRAIKDDQEIRLIEKACQISDQAFNYVLSKVKTRITEKELAFEIEFFIKKNGVELSFPPIVAFGKNSSIPHYQTGSAKLVTKNGLFILIDFGVRVDSYCSDMTRTIFFGDPSEEQEKIYQVVLESQQKAVNFINSLIKSRKKIKAVDVDRIARDYIISKEYPSIPHSLGHGIGLEVHEHPYLSQRSKEELKTGMVFSIEPGIYIPNFGGVRIEDLYVLEKDRVRQLTNSAKNLETF